MIYFNQERALEMTAREWISVVYGKEFEGPTDFDGYGDLVGGNVTYRFRRQADPYQVVINAWMSRRYGGHCLSEFHVTATGPYVKYNFRHFEGQIKSTFHVYPDDVGVELKLGGPLFVAMSKYGEPGIPSADAYTMRIPHGGWVPHAISPAITQETVETAFALRGIPYVVKKGSVVPL